MPSAATQVPRPILREVGDGPQNQNGKAEAITAFVIPAHMLPGSLGTNPYQLGQNQLIELVR